MHSARLLIATLACVVVATAAAAAPLKTPASRIPSPAGPGSGEPFLAVGPGGQVWLSWFERRGPEEDAGHALKLSMLEGRRWSEPRTIAEGDSFFVNWADYPTILPLGNDRLVAHWPWMSGGESPYAYDVWVSQSSDGGRSWSKPMRPHRDGTPTEHGFVSMVRDGDGARMVWLDGRNFAKQEGGGHDGHGDGLKAEMTLRTARLGTDGRLTEEAVVDGRVCDCCNTDMVNTSAGVLVGFRDRSAEEIRDISLSRRTDGGWSEVYPLHRDGWEIPGCPVNGPALDAAGEHVIAAWYTGAGEGDHVRAAFSRDGGRSFGAPIAVDEGNPVGRVDVALLADGSALVAWMEQTAKNATIRVRWLDRQGRPHRAWTLARTRSARSSGFPRMVRSGRRLVFAWTEPGQRAQVRTAVAELR